MYKTTKERLRKAKKELESTANCGSDKDYLKAINEEMGEFKIIRVRAYRASII